MRWSCTTCLADDKLLRIEYHGFWFNCSNNLSSFSGIGDPACERLKLVDQYGNCDSVTVTVWQSSYVFLFWSFNWIQIFPEFFRLQPGVSVVVTILIICFRMAERGGWPLADDDRVRNICVCADSVWHHVDPSRQEDLLLSLCRWSLSRLRSVILLQIYLKIEFHCQK